ncbi:MAG: ATP-dependent endonuclease, partial [Candidatus Dadabacteria bacterium]|nr:ATP-dependent endonuclease [Candidatus Dadabacteria bacterium]
EGVAERKHRFHMAYWVNPDRGEMLFARRVVFVEGETEKVLFPYLADKLGCHSEDVSLIDCGSKHNLPLYAKIAEAFKLDYMVIHDEDPLPETIPEEWGEDKIREKRHLFQFNEVIQGVVGESRKVVVLSPDFEGFSGVSNTQAKKKGKALAALDHFKDIDADDIPQNLKDVVHRIYGNEKPV